MHLILLQVVISLLAVHYVRSDILYRDDECIFPDGSAGTCIPILDCKWLRTQIQAKRIKIQNLKEYRCSFEDRTEITCCKLIKSSDVVPDQSLSRNIKRPSDLACNIYKNSRKLPVSYNIIGGVKSQLYAHIAALGYACKNGVEFRCAGSLISNQFVLTAAHCVKKNDFPIIVRLGAINVDDDHELHAQNFEIDHVKLHPKYVSNLVYHIALIRLNETVEYTGFIQPACLKSSMEDPSRNQVLTVIGWGITNLTVYTSANILLETNLTIYNFEDCKRKYGSNYRLPNGLNNGQMCAFDFKNKSDACHGDSGGPLQINLAKNKINEIVGIVSSGISCGSNTPGLYTKVSYYLNWIENEVWGSI